MSAPPPFTDEHEELRASVRGFLERELAPHAQEWEDARWFPDEVFGQLAGQGLLGLKYPIELGGQGGFGEGQLLPDFHWSRLMTEACEQQLHCVTLNRRPVCATHVMAEQPTAAITMRAAFRPRHPAVTRRNTIAR